MTHVFIRSRRPDPIDLTDLAKHNQAVSRDVENVMTRLDAVVDRIEGVGARLDAALDALTVTPKRESDRDRRPGNPGLAH